MVQLPDDLVRDILSFVPVRSLLRFRCVSKQLYALIDSPCFIKQHLVNHCNIRTISKQIIVIIGINSFTRQSVVADQPLIKHIFQLNYTNILGTVNGLLCLSDRTGQDIIIWNLATRKHHELPSRPSGLSPLPGPYTYHNSGTSFGFGYDSVSDDYKLLWINRFSVSSGGVNYSVIRAQVYNLKSNSWKMLQDFPNNILISIESRGKFVCGALHWMALLPHSIDIFAFKPVKEKHDQIAAFDLASDKYRLVIKPDIRVEDTCHMSVGELEGCLSLTCNYISGHVDVWVMRDYGGKESWSKLFSVPQLKKISSSRVCTPLAYSENRDEILLVVEHKNLVWYNPHTKKVRVIYVLDEFEAWICGESMVPLDAKDENYFSNGSPIWPQLIFSNFSRYLRKS